MRILILDGVNKNTLAIVRHLGRLKAGELHVVSYQRWSITFASKYTSRRIILPKPSNEELYMAELLKVLQNESYELLVPVGYKSFQLCSKYQDELKKYTKVFLPSYEAMEVASNKIRTQQLAEKLDVPVPKTFVIKHADELLNIEFSYPVVIKAPLELGKSIVDYAYNREELVSKFNNVSKKYDSSECLPIIQEYIEGDGAGFFAYYTEGECKRIFMHKRVREYPASGGASVCAEAFYDERLQSYGTKLLDALKWNGVAMVEFKMNLKTSDYVLMEINPKFWGSLDLSLVSGVVFPYFMVQDAKGEEVQKDYTFQQNKRFQWLLNGELYHFLERPASFFKICKDLFRSKNDVWLRDPLPAIFQLMMIPIDMYKKLKQ